MKIGPLEISFGSNGKTKPSQGGRGRPPRLPADSRSWAELTSNMQLTSDWHLGTDSTNAKLRSHLPRMVNMCRALAETNPYFRRFLTEWVANIVGPQGIKFQSEIAFANGRPDENKRKVIEDAWKEWSETAWAHGATYVEGAQTVERSVARDGFCFVRILRNYDNPHRFALQMLDWSYLNLEASGKHNGNQVIAGVEVDAFGKPVAYHLRTNTTNATGDDLRLSVFGGNRAVRIPATELIMRFYRETPEQVVGFPMAAAAVTALRHLEKYEEAEVVAARVAACSTMSIENTNPETFTGEDGDDLLANLEMTPGGTLNMPDGVSAKLLSPNHPNTAFNEFRVSMLKGAASACMVSHSALSSDYSEANYSSLRAEKLAQTDVYRTYQGMVIAQQERPIFDAWLEMQLVAGTLPFELTGFSALRKARWQPRGWDWVDPQKEVAAVEKSLQLNITSRKRETAKRGIDMDELDEEIEADEKHEAANAQNIQAMPEPAADDAEEDEADSQATA